MKLVSVCIFFNSFKDVFVYLVFGIVGSENYKFLCLDKIVEYDVSII